VAGVTTRPLVLVAHGTADPTGVQVLEDLAGAVWVALAEAGRDVPVRLAHLERAAPVLEDVVGVGEAPVVVPLFLARGYHVRTDLPGRLARLAPDALLTPTLGAGPAVLEALRRRVAGHVRPGSGVVLATAGSSDDGARAEVDSLGAELEASAGVPVRVARLSAGGPSVAEAVATLRGLGRSHLIGAVHLLAPGHFWDRAQRALAEPVFGATTSPLATDRAVVEAVVGAYREAVAAAPGPRSTG